MKSDEMLKSGRGVIIMDETMIHNKNVSYCPSRLRDCIFVGNVVMLFWKLEQGLNF